MAQGIVTRHHRKCPSRSGGKCGKPCTPTYQAWVFSARGGHKKIRKTFPTLAAAKAWRADALGEVRRGRLAPPNGLTVREAADALIAGMKEGTIYNRNGQRFKPSVIRGYEADLKGRIIPELGALKLTAVGPEDVEHLVATMLKEGLSPSKVRNALMPLRVIFRQHKRTVPVNPTEGIDLPRPRPRKRQIAELDQARKLLAALPPSEQALWATAFYAGLRRGELRALRWNDVDLDKGIIRVERSWDDVEGEVEPKSDAGRRTVPIIARLRDYLTEHQARTRKDGLVFGTSAETPFTPSNVRRKANLVWSKVKPPLEPIELQEARHTFASILIDADVNAKQIQRYMGHSSITVTYDIYGHLFERHEAAAAAKVDDYLALVDTAGRLAQIG
jgi:integrase